MEPRQELAEASEEAHVGHGHPPGTLDLDREMVADLGIAETLHTIRAHLENDDPTIIAEGLDWSRAVFGKVLGPAADVEIVRLKAPPPGVYLVEITVSTGDAIGDVGNLALKIADAVKFPAIFSRAAPAVYRIARLRLRGGEDLSIHAIAAGGAAVYAAQIVATRIEAIEAP